MLYDDLVQPGEYICHHGIKGQKWGIRRYQNSDGSLTEQGQERYKKNLSKVISDRNRTGLIRLNMPIIKNLEHERVEVQDAYTNLLKISRSLNDDLNYYLMKKLYNLDKKDVQKLPVGKRLEYTSSIDYLRAGFSERDKFFKENKEYIQARDRHIKAIESYNNKLGNEIDKFLGSLGKQEVENIPNAVSVTKHDTGFTTGVPTYSQYLRAILQV